ncbi:MAG: DNA cytosine methyltransferase [Desulfobacteraceae bacterium]|nr:DNA cytosine methyltransferase [Desulfobacteraceae bacterium]
MKNSKRLKAIDFFSGAGGLTCGLRSAGITVLAGIDNDDLCRETYEKNNKGSVFLNRDITTYEPDGLRRDRNIEKNDDCMIFAACAPCQFWSLIQTSREKSNKSKDLILDFQRFVEYFTPGFIIVENVPGISFKKNSPMGLFIGTVISLGYSVAYNITDMSLYGIPQRRRRFTLLGSRISDIELPKPNGRKRTVRDVLGYWNGFPRIAAGTRDKTVFMHTAASLSEKNLQRLKMTEADGGDRSSWQNNVEFQLPCYASEEKKFYDTYGRMWWDRPSPTITTKFRSISNGRFAHPEEHRAISLREGATLQTFPKMYRFIGTSMESIARMIGNAVPPEFARTLGRCIIKSARSMGEV